MTLPPMSHAAGALAWRSAAFALTVSLIAPWQLVGQSPDHDALRQLKTVDWPRAYQTQDLQLLDRILADDFRVIRSDGQWSSKQEELAWLRANRPSYDSLVFTITRLDVYPNGTAIVAGTGAVHSAVDGRPRLVEYQSTNILLRQQDGSWRAVASHTSGNRERAVADHHVHLLGPDVMRDWKSLGVTFSRPDSVYTSPGSLLDGTAAPVTFAVLVPMAHLYADADFAGGLGIDGAEARRRGRRENAHVARIAASYPGRAAALCSVPALAEWALEELAFCRDSLGVTGIKLHLASSQVDLRDPAHRRRVAAVVRFASESDLPLLMHLDPQRRGHDSTHIRTFAAEVFGPHPEVTVVIAHLGGSGGYGPWTQTVFRTVSSWLRTVEGSGPRRRIYFDLSAAVLEQPSEGVAATTDAEAARLREDLRAVALDRIVYGSDYPVFDPGRGLEVLRDRVGLSAEEVMAIARGPILRLFAPVRGGR